MSPFNQQDNIRSQYLREIAGNSTAGKKVKTPVTNEGQQPREASNNRSKHFSFSQALFNPENNSSGSNRPQLFASFLR